MPLRARSRWWFALGLVTVLSGPQRHQRAHATAGEDACPSHRDDARRLAPSQLPPPHFFDGFDAHARNVSLDGAELTVLRGSILQGTSPTSGAATEGAGELKSELVVLRGLLPRSVVGQMLTLLRGHEDADEAAGRTTVVLDRDPDSVDGMTSQEIFLDNDNLRDGRTSKGYPAAGDGRAGRGAGPPVEDMGERRALRRQLRALTDRYADVVLAGFLEEWYGHEKCGRDGRRCRPCYSLIRRYRAGERQSHAPHHDAHSFVTVVVSLTDYGREYSGGLYVSTKNSERNYVRLDRGDAVVHQGDLHHGVRVLDQRDDGGPSERWSWIMWFRDSDLCEDHSDEWHRGCAEEGNPACMYLYATKQATPEGQLLWNGKASVAGHAQASVKLAYAYLKVLPSHLDFDAGRARELFAAAIKSSGDPDGHYGMASLYLAEAHIKILSQPSTEDKQRAAIEARDSALVTKAIGHLEDAARGGHAFAMFNLGICHTYGYGTRDGARDPELAAEWFEASGLPEGLFAKSLYLDAVGREEEAESYRRKAAILGFGSGWRQRAREQTGNGGSAGPKLNLKWPHLPGGVVPPEW